MVRRFLRSLITDLISKFSNKSGIRISENKMADAVEPYYFFYCYQIDSGFVLSRVSVSGFSCCETSEKNSGNPKKKVMRQAG